MSSPPCTISVAVAEPVGFVKVQGRANFSISGSFRTMMTNLSERGCVRFMVDLAECSIVDSTFLGVLVGLALGPRSGAASQPPHITLLNANPRLTELIDSLGVASLFCLIDAEKPFSGALETLDLGAKPTDKTESTRTCLEAHKTLMAINPANIPKFKDVAQFLEEDLKRSAPKDETKSTDQNGDATPPKRPE